jgi:hypothetical protein
MEIYRRACRTSGAFLPAKCAGFYVETVIHNPIAKSGGPDAMFFALAHLADIIRSDRAAMFEAQKLGRIVGAYVVENILYFLYHDSIL